MSKKAKIIEMLPDKIGDGVLKLRKKYYTKTYLNKFARVFTGTTGMELGGVVVITDFNTLDETFFVKTANDYFQTEGFTDDGQRWIKKDDLTVINLNRPESGTRKYIITSLFSLASLALGYGLSYIGLV